jgi:hypothetical protein
MESAPVQGGAGEDHARTENKRITQAHGPKVAADENQKIGGDIKMGKNPAFIAERKVVFD